VRIEIINVPPLLQRYIDRIFHFQGSGLLPSSDLKLIVPNARIKLVIPLMNGIVGTVGSFTHVSRTNKMTLIGISDLPGEVDILRDEPAENITVEFSPLGAYRFFRLQWSDIRNQIHDYSDIDNVSALDLEDKISNTESFTKKLGFVMTFLDQLFKKSKGDEVFECCVEKILSTRGTVTLKELEKRTGYSARWLNMKFDQHLGMSPKNLASLIRFQQYYRHYTSNAKEFFEQKEFYRYYYDQSHFIKDFKRFTGFPPLRFYQKQNSYDRLFY
jgi:methylphosphotriester-DNA--protein-cysteine methyltransferase